MSVCANQNSQVVQLVSQIAAATGQSSGPRFLNIFCSTLVQVAQLEWTCVGAVRGDGKQKHFFSLAGFHSQKIFNSISIPLPDVNEHHDLEKMLFDQGHEFQVVLSLQDLFNKINGYVVLGAVEGLITREILEKVIAVFSKRLSLEVGLIEEKKYSLVRDRPKLFLDQFLKQFPTATLSDLADYVAGEIKLPTNSHLLCVDDEVDLMEIEVESLGRLGYAATGVSDSLVALEMIRANPERYDVLITDIRMPNLNGLELAERVKVLSPNTRIVAISGHFDPREQDKYPRSGIEYFLEKPLDLDSLLKTIEAFKKSSNP